MPKGFRGFQKGVKVNLGKHWKRKPFTQEHRKKLSLAKIGKKGHSSWNKGLTKETDIRIARYNGINNWHYKKDRTTLCRTSKQGERRTSIYFNWRKEVWKRDNWTCKINNKDCKGRLEAHHILPWEQYPELRYEIKNGITLCHYHHPRKRVEEQKLIPFFLNILTATKYE